MIIGHLPAGYLGATGVERIIAVRALFLGIMAGAVLPDIDILWFYIVDNRSFHHHGYLPHRPIVWLSALLIGLTLKRHLVIGLGLGGLLHMVLDTLLGQIAWGRPVFDTVVTWIDVPAIHGHWILSFMAHWTFAIEIALVLAALVVWFRRKYRT